MTRILNRRRRIAGIVVLTTAALVSGCRDRPDPSSTDAPRPNIALIMADDLGTWESAVCAPFRSVLMTGQHTGRAPIWGNTSVKPTGQEPLPDSTATVAKILKAAGYRTGMLGAGGRAAHREAQSDRPFLACLPVTIPHAALSVPASAQPRTRTPRETASSRNPCARAGTYADASKRTCPRTGQMLDINSVKEREIYLFIRV